VSDALIEARDLSRSYRSFLRRPGLMGGLRDLFAPSATVAALSGLDLDVSAGERLALLGPNGAGKSTMVKLLCGILEPTSGSLRVAGRVPAADRRAHVRQIGVVFGQRTGLWWDLPVQEALALQAAVFSLSVNQTRVRLAELDRLLDLEPLLGRPVRELSLGQRVRCELAAAMLHRPRLLLLDEPTIGLDVSVKLRLRHFLRGLADDGVTVVLTTHDLSDVAAVCDRVVLLDRGRRRFDGTLDDLELTLGVRRIVRVTLDRDWSGRTLPDGAIPADLVAETAVQDGVVSLAVPAGQSSAAVVPRLLRALDGSGVKVAEMAVDEPDIEALVAAAYGAPL
jgi:ABC-2 type transport system ATP-binding protein